MPRYYATVSIICFIFSLSLPFGCDTQRNTPITSQYRVQSADNTKVLAATIDSRGNSVIFYADNNGQPLESVYSLVKVDSFGNELWRNTALAGEAVIGVNASFTAMYDYPTGRHSKLEVDASDNLYIWAHISGVKERSYIAMISNTGDVVWENTYSVPEGQEIHSSASTMIQAREFVYYTRRKTTRGPNFSPNELADTVVSILHYDQAGTVTNLYSGGPGRFIASNNNNNLYIYEVLATDSATGQTTSTIKTLTVTGQLLQEMSLLQDQLVKNLFVNADDTLYIQYDSRIEKRQLTGSLLWQVETGDNQRAPRYKNYPTYQSTGEMVISPDGTVNNLSVLSIKDLNLRELAVGYHFSQWNSAGQVNFQFEKYYQSSEKFMDFQSLVHNRTQVKNINYQLDQLNNVYIKDSLLKEALYYVPLPLFLYTNQSIITKFDNNGEMVNQVYATGKNEKYLPFYVDARGSLTHVSAIRQSDFAYFKIFVPYLGYIIDSYISESSIKWNWVVNYYDSVF